MVESQDAKVHGHTWAEFIFPIQLEGSILIADGLLLLIISSLCSNGCHCGIQWYFFSDLIYLRKIISPEISQICFYYR
jgi:hypothetical protein